MSKLGNKANGAKDAAKERSRAIADNRNHTKALESCPYCVEGSRCEKQLLVSLGTAAYVALPARGSLAPGHCYIAPLRHASAYTSLDEDVCQEIEIFQRALVKMFAAQVFRNS